jgi:hypothetical protein
MNDTTDAESNRDWRLFYGALALGLVLVLLGMFSLGLGDLDPVDARVVLYAGIGILLGAFGSEMTIKLKGITIFGVAAITIGLLWLAHNWTAVSYVEGVINGDVDKVANIYVIGDQTFLGATEAPAVNVSRYRFVVPKSEFVSARTVTIALDPGSDRELPPFIIPNDLLKVRGSRVSLRLDLDKEQIRDENTGEVLASLGRRLPTLPLGAAAPADRRGPLALLVPAANAQGDVSELLKQLESPNAIVRRQTRILLAQHGPTAVPMMIGAYREAGASYQVRLGVLVALTEMLRLDKSQAGAVSGQLAVPDLAALVQALADRDRTIRIYAGEFLYDLGDPRVVEPALGLARDVDFADRTIDAEQGRYLAIFVVGGAMPRLAGDDRRDVDCALLQLRASPATGKDTIALIDKLVTPNVRCP